MRPLAALHLEWGLSRCIRSSVVAAILTCIFSAHLSIAASPLPDRQIIERLTGATASVDSIAGVVKVSLPRNDVVVTVDRLTLPPFMGLTSWAAFKTGDSAQAMVMGDLVLFADEVNSVMSACLDAGLQVTALHNHFMFDNPKVYFMHIGGEGHLEDLAKAAGLALHATDQIRHMRPMPEEGTGPRLDLSNSSISPAPIEQTLGGRGQAKDGMLKIVIGRKTKMPCGCEVGAAMGVNTWAAFAGADSLAVVDGDFAMLDDEVQPVLKALRHGGINVVAIHNHMIGESPRMIFLHFWGIGPAVDLARVLRAALDTQSGGANQR